MKTNELKDVCRVAFGAAGVACLTVVSVPVDVAAWTAQAIGRGLSWVSGRLRAARASLASGVGASAHELALAAGDAVYGPAGPAPAPAPEYVPPPAYLVDLDTPAEAEPVILPVAAPAVVQDAPEPVAAVPEPEPMPAAAQTTVKQRRTPAKRISREAAFEMAAALIDKGSSRRAAAAAAGVSESTLRGWLAKRVAAVT